MATSRTSTGATTGAAGAAPQGTVESGGGPRTDQGPENRPDAADAARMYGTSEEPEDRRALDERRKEAAAKLREDGYRVVKSGVVAGENVLVVAKDGKLTSVTVGPQGGLHHEDYKG